jgi:hypothetical protein
MKIRIIIIALICSFGVFSACTEKKKTEETKTENKIETEVISKEDKTPVVNTIDKAEKRRLDSIRQVKEHGHAH